MTRWSGHFIAPTTSSNRASFLRKDIVIDPEHGSIVEATARVSALGLIEAYLNGAPLSEDVLTPGWTSYEWRLRYAEYDLTARLSEVVSGELAIGLVIGNGWYRGRLGWEEAPPYGPDIAGFFELRIRFDDGYEQIIATDASWRASASDTTSDSIYDGQSIDARLRQPGWNEIGYDDSRWSDTRIVDFDLERLTPYVGPPVRRQMSVGPEKAWRSPSGGILIDFGQNLVGWIKLEVIGSCGDQISLRHAEVLENGELGVRPLRTAQATDRFILSGGPDVFEPTFTFHGFRYVELTGWPGSIDELLDGSITAVVVNSELQRIGRFSCSDELLNQLHRNVVWGMQGNFLDVPTDCPQRDERLGWTGDIAVFAPTAAYLFDVQDFLRDWLRDLTLEQHHHDGVVPFVVPDIFKYAGTPPEFDPLNSTAVWSDAAAWVPWALWQAYGDEDILRESFASMASHARHVRSLLSPNGTWSNGFQFGDWLDPDAPPEAADQAKADKSVVATAAAFRTATIVSETAKILGETDAVSEFEELAIQLRTAFRAEYVHSERIYSDCTTVYSLAIAFGLLEPGEHGWAGRRLAELVADSGYRISTGFAGTPFILDALSSTGHLDVAYRLLLQQECPSWLYPVTMGATTIWERWDSILPNGSINPGEMTSFNHYAFGAVADWMHRVVGGLSPLSPGYQTVLVEPRPGGDLSWAETSLATPHGMVSVRWERVESGLRVDIDAPTGVSVVLRGANDDELLPAGSHRRLVAAD